MAGPLGALGIGAAAAGGSSLAALFSRIFMWVFWAWIGVIVARILAAIGIFVISYSGADLLVQVAIDTMNNYIGTAPVWAIAHVASMGFFDAAEIMFSALVFSLAAKPIIGWSMRA